jgi:hypothetical protein
VKDFTNSWVKEVCLGRSRVQGFFLAIVAGCEALAALNQKVNRATSVPARGALNTVAVLM